MGVAPARSCKRCRGCKECSYRNTMISREKELVVRRVEDLIQYDAEAKKVSVTYPWTEDVCKLTDNMSQAIAFQSSVERKLLRDKSLLEAYNKELQKFIDRGAIRKLTAEEIASYSGPVSYVSHHGVHKPDSITTPLRIVTNSSLKNVNAGLSPNECMQEGPNALSSLLEVIIGFRMYEVALVYDMTKAYQSISTGELERHVRRIVWRWCNTSAPWDILAYEVLTFGDQIAALVLELIKKLAAQLGESIDAEACVQIRSKTYVDDGAGGGNRAQVDRYRGELVDGHYNGTIPTILGLVGLKLKTMVASGDSDPDTLALLGDKVLGHVWKPTEDKFVFKIPVNLSTSKNKGLRSERDLTPEDIPRLPIVRFTRRMLLGFVMSPYDPMGLICPLTIKLKLQLRSLYGPDSSLGWDDPLPENEHKAWEDLLAFFINLGEIVLDRAVKPEGTVGAPELIGFADGSLEAYACAVYIRWLLQKAAPDDPDKFFVRLICGKARVTPLKGTTPPRSELSGFLILTRLLKAVVNAMEIKPSQITPAVDSQCTIAAMEKSGGLLAPYFASRVSEAAANLAELAEVTIVNPIQHVPGPQNPADIPTRPNASYEDVAANSIWQNGPDYLSLPRESWPFSRDFLDQVPEQELRAPKAAFNAANPVLQNRFLGPELTRLASKVMNSTYSLSKATNVMARLLQASFRGDRERIQEPLTVPDIKVAADVLFAASMGPTLVALEAGKLDSLRPIVRNNIVYARSRCDKSSLSKLLGVSSLPILARDTQLARLIMWEAHNEDHRASSIDVLARSRQRAWIIRGRHLAKWVTKSCPRCKLLRKKLSEQLMADIPEHQLTPCPPFSYISIDFAGPYKAKAMGNSRATLKVWALVIICQNTRAIKMYAVAGYSTDDFLTAYRRFTANHGYPLLVVSDAGSQLKKAGKLIDQGDKLDLDWDKISHGAAKNGTKWKAVEPGCQWRNGLAEAAVKLVKSTLDLTLASQSTLNYAELDTLFSSVANTVNQRPIAIRNFTDEDLHAITPNDLLLGRTKNVVPGAQFSREDSITKRQEVLKELEETWWNQWIVQALPHLVPYKRWKTEHRSLQVGDVVMVLYEKKVGKGEYKLGRVIKVHPDSHGLVRTVTVGMRGKESGPVLPYVGKPLQEHKLGVQRIAVICPIEEQNADISDSSETTEIEVNQATDT